MVDIFVSLVYVSPYTFEVSLIMQKPEKILAVPLEIVSNYYLCGAPFGFYPTPKFGRVDVGTLLLGFRFIR